MAPIPAYGEGVPREVEIPEASLIELFAETVERFGERPALDFFGSVTSYAQLAEQVRAAASVLAEQGVHPGDRVAIVLPTCPQGIVAFYAVLSLGAVVVEHNPLSTREELQRTFADHTASAAVVWDKAASVVASLDLAAPPAMLTVDMSRALPLAKRLALRLPLPAARKARAAMTERARAGLSFDDAVRRQLKSLASAGDEGAEPLIRERVSPDSLALLQYTGGTTGAPKAAMLTHRNLAANVAQSMAWVPSLMPGQEVFYGILPLFHAYGMTLCLLDAIRLGACLVLFPRFDEQAVIAAMSRRPATFMPGVPPIFARLAAAAEEGRVDLGTVKWGISGAMPLDAALVDRWEALTGGMLIEGYGMTETAPIAAGNPFSPQRRPGSIGLPFPSTQIRLADPDAPESVRPGGEAGEMQIKGPQVFAGYWNRSEETAQMFTGDGWLRTGDVAVQDEQGFLTIVDRIKDVILSGGFNVYPSEVEDALREAPGVKDVAVVGLAGEGRNETVTAVIVPESGQEPVLAALQKYARQHLAGYKIPRKLVLTEALPLSPIGKVLRRELRERLGRG